MREGLEALGAAVEESTPGAKSGKKIPPKEKPKRDPLPAHLRRD